VRPGDTATARARAVLETVCTVADSVVIDGVAKVMVSRRG
jgi:hypothetical protein